MSSRKSSNNGSEHAVQTALLLAAANGSEKAFGELVKLYRPLIEASVAPYAGTFSYDDCEELHQEALLAFHKAVQRYDPLYGDISFGAFAKICVSNAVTDALRRISRANRISIVPLDEISESASASADPAESIIAEESAAELRSFIRSSLSPFENTVWWSFYSGMSCAEIAKATGKSEKSVSNALCRVRQKLRRLLS